MRIKIHKKVLASLTYKVGGWDVLHSEDRRKKTVHFEISNSEDGIRVDVSVNVKDLDNIVYTAGFAEVKDGEYKTFDSKKKLDSFLKRYKAPLMDELVMGMLKSNAGGKLAKISRKIVSTMLKGGGLMGASVLASFALMPFGLTALLPALLLVGGAGVYVEMSGLKSIINELKEPLTNRI